MNKAQKVARQDEDNCIVSFVKRFDFYKDLPDSLSEPTLTGASVSIVLLSIIGILLTQATYQFIQFQKQSSIMIDVNSGDEKLHINLDITLPKSPCAILSLDIVDVTGVHLVDIEGKLNKYRLDKHGKEIEMIQHIEDGGHAEVDAKNVAEQHFLQSEAGQRQTQKVLEETIQGLKDQEGCKLSGFVFINKVPGNFHISGHHYPEVVQRLYMQGHSLDFTHKINHLSFGDLGDIEHIEKNFGEKFKFELDGRDIQQSKFVQPGMMGFMGPNSLFVNYFLEISQVDYVDETAGSSDSGSTTDTPQTFEAFQFRSSQTIKVEGGMPAIFFRYELSPIRIQYTMSLQSVSSFLVRVCSIVGGIYAVSSIIESLLRNSLSMFEFGGLGGEQDIKRQAAQNPGRSGGALRGRQGPGRQATHEQNEQQGITAQHQYEKVQHQDSIEMTTQYA